MTKILAISHAYCEPFTRAGLVDKDHFPGIEYSVVIPEFEIKRNPAGFKQLTGEFENIYPLRTYLDFHQSVRFYGAGLWNLLKDTRPEIVFVNNEPWSTTAFQTAMFLRLLKLDSRLIVYTCENLERNYRQPFKLFEKYVLKNCYAIAHLALHEGKQILDIKGYKGRTYYLPLAADAGHFRKRDASEIRKKLGFSGSDRILGFAGRLVEEKGIQTAIKALTLLEDNFKLLLVGSGPYRDELSALARSLKVERRVLFINAVINQELPFILCAMDAFLLPSLTTKNWKEQFGRVLVEAMACEIPVIGSSSGEIPVVMGEAGIVFRENDEKDLCEKIRALFKDPVKMSGRGRAGRERVLELYDKAVVMRRTVAMFKEILNENTR